MVISTMLSASSSSSFHTSLPVSLTPNTDFGEGGALRLIRRIGQGGMGEVWLAHDKTLDIDRAVKILLPGRMDEPELRRFSEEARLLAKFDDSNGIVRIHSTGTDPASRRPYFVMDAHLLDSEQIHRICTTSLGLTAAAADRLANPGSPPRPFTLQDVLGNETASTARQIPERAVLALAREIAVTLGRLHAQGVIHRDLKPSNLLFAADGQLLLADFGIAKTLDSTHPRNTLSGLQPGSPRYAAPEQMDGRPATPAVDWYALGIVLYRALYSSFPEWGEDFPTLAGLRPVSSHWERLLRDLLAKDPRRRLSDSDAVLRTLDRIGLLSTRSQRRRHLRPWLIALSLLTVLVGVIALVLLPSENGSVPVQSGTDIESPEPAINMPAPDQVQPGTQTEQTDAEAEKTETQPKDFSAPERVPIRPPRLPDIWQGDDRGPLQLLNTFRMTTVDSVVNEALAQVATDIRQLIQKGDNAWSASPRDIKTANRAYYAAASQLDMRLAAATDTNAPVLRVCFAVAMSRLAWTYVITKSRGASDIPYRDALRAVTPLFESDAPRYAPLRSWLLAERAYMECMETRFDEALQDLREATTLWAHYGYDPDDPGNQAQMTVLIASLGGMFRKIGMFDQALATTTEAIKHLAPLLPGDGGNTPLTDLLAGCHYRQGELFKREGDRMDSLLSYRRAIGIWRHQFQLHGEPFRLTYAQVLGRVASAYAELDEMTEAIAAWDELRDVLRPLLESDPEQYRPVFKEILHNSASAYRKLGDDDSARARDAEADALNTVSPEKP